MRTRIHFQHEYSVLALSAALLGCAGSAFGQANQGRSQVVYLPDPTPRHPELELLLRPPAPGGASTTETTERRNARRRELVQWAANEMVTLSTRLEADAAKPPTAGSMAADAASAARIEMLAKNLTAALKAQ